MQHTPTEVAHDLWRYSSSACDCFVSASSRLRSAKANPYRCSHPLTSCMVRSLGIAMMICVCSPPPSPPYGRILVYAGSNGICTYISRSSSARRHFLGEAKECTAVSCVSVCMRTLALCAYGHALSAVQRQVSDTGCPTGVSVLERIESEGSDTVLTFARIIRKSAAMLWVVVCRKLPVSNHLAFASF